MRTTALLATGLFCILIAWGQVARASDVVPGFRISVPTDSTQMSESIVSIEAGLLLEPSVKRNIPLPFNSVLLSLTVSPGHFRVGIEGWLTIGYPLVRCSAARRYSAAARLADGHRSIVY